MDQRRRGKTIEDDRDVALYRWCYPQEPASTFALRCIIGHPEAPPGLLSALDLPLATGRGLRHLRGA